MGETLWREIQLSTKDNRWIKGDGLSTKDNKWINGDGLDSFKGWINIGPNEKTPVVVSIFNFLLKHWTYFCNAVSKNTVKETTFGPSLQGWTSLNQAVEYCKVQSTAFRGEGGQGKGIVNYHLACIILHPLSIFCHPPSARLMTSRTLSASRTKPRTGTGTRMRARTTVKVRIKVRVQMRTAAVARRDRWTH